MDGSEESQAREEVDAALCKMPECVVDFRESVILEASKDMSSGIRCHNGA